MPHLIVLLKRNYKRSYTVITRFMSSAAQMLLPDNHELHLRILKLPRPYRGGTNGRTNDSKPKFLLRYGIATVICNFLII